MNFKDIDFVKLTIDKNEPEKIESRAKELIEIMNFSELSSLKDLETFGISYEYVNSKNFDFYELLSLNQKKEYLNVFYHSKDQKIIKEYAKTRLSRIFENALCYSFDFDNIKNELAVINQLTEFKHKKYIIDLILTLEYILSNDSEEINSKIKVFKFLSNLFRLSENFKLKFNYSTKDYEIKSESLKEPSTLLLIRNIPSKKLKHLLLDLEITSFHSKRDLIKFYIDEDFDRNFRKLRVHSIKESKLISQMLEPLCKELIKFILNFENKPKIFSASFSPFFYRLSRSFFTQREFEKSIYWIDQFFFMIKNIHNSDLYINEFEFKDFESLMSKSLQKLKVENEKRLKKKLSSQITIKAYEDARSFVRSIGLKSESEWRLYKKSGNKPIDIPSAPSRVYKDKGWINWQDWLGTDALVVYRNFEDAKNFVIALNLESTTFWRKYCSSGNKPKDIPSNPNVVYKNKDWKNWGDWLGTGVNKDNLNPTFLEFESAKKYVKQRGLKSVSEWRIFKKSDLKPLNIPSNPDRVYKNNGWENWGDWLGTGVKSSNSNNFLNFKEARSYVKGLSLRNESQWRQYKKTGEKPKNIPSHPDRVYKNKGWINWKDWLGTT